MCMHVYHIISLCVRVCLCNGLWLASKVLYECTGV